MFMIGLAAAALLFAAEPEDKTALKTKLKDEVGARWIYDDFAAGLAEARKTGKPLCVTIRCTH
jgi:hypothetical protein